MRSVTDGLEISARVLTVEARKKGGEKSVLQSLRNIVQVAKLEEQRRVEEGAARSRREYLRKADQAIVCAFMAEVEFAMSHARGPLLPGRVWNVPTLTIGKIADALQRAGYHPNGYREPGSVDQATDQT